MTTTEKPAIPPMPSTPPRAVEAVRVKELYLPDERVVPLRDCEGTMRRISAGKARRVSGVTVEIQYEPWQRHHRVREITEGAHNRQVTNEFCISEVGVLYVPEPPS